MVPQPTKTIALAGQPNVGKSTLFNLLTGLHQHTGNWTGKTVERKEGQFQFRGVGYRLVDLPGTYSLTSGSPEERIAREYIVRENPDLVVAVINAALLERGLYLVAELLALQRPLVIALNMIDVAEREGILIEPDVLSAALGVPVVPLQATKKSGIPELMETISAVTSGRLRSQPRKPDIREDHRELLTTILDMIGDADTTPYPREWIAMKILEGDEEAGRFIQTAVTGDTWKGITELLRRHDDALVAVATGRYEWITRMVRAALVRPQAGPISLTHRLDRWLTAPWWGVLAFAAVMAAVFSLTYALGIPLQEILDREVVQRLQHAVETGGAAWPWWARGMLAEGVFGGIGTLLTFLPILGLFFGLTALLEDVGYLARAAFVMDRFMHAMGLHGKSCLPLIIGFGCNVPGVLGSRVIESARARLLTLFLVPLVPCTGRMAVIAFLAPVFFGGKAALVTGSLIVLALAVLFISGLIGGRVFFPQERAAFIMELPLYHVPNARTIGLLVWQRSLEFIRKAVRVILPVSLVIWALSRFPSGNVEQSWLASFSRGLEPVGAWMGFDWRLIVALLAGFIAKENTLATLAVLFGAGGGAALSAMIQSAYTPAAGLAFMVSQLLFIPCVATVAAIRQESRSWRLTLFNISYLFLLSTLLATAVFQAARAIGMDL